MEILAWIVVGLVLLAGLILVAVVAAGAWALSLADSGRDTPPAAPDTDTPPTAPR